MRAVLIRCTNQGARMGDPDPTWIVPEVFKDKAAAQRYVAEKPIRAGRIEYLVRQVRG